MVHNNICNFEFYCYNLGVFFNEEGLDKKKQVPVQRYIVSTSRKATSDTAILGHLNWKGEKINLFLSSPNVIEVICISQCNHLFTVSTVFSLLFVFIKLLFVY